MEETFLYIFPVLGLPCRTSLCYSCGRGHSCPAGRWDLSSLTLVKSEPPAWGSMKPSPLDNQGIHFAFFLSKNNRKYFTYHLDDVIF